MVTRDVFQLELEKRSVVQSEVNPVTGIGNITVETALTDDVIDMPSYGTGNISVGRAELANFDLTRIVVVGV